LVVDKAGKYTDKVFKPWIARNPATINSTFFLASHDKNHFFSACQS
jgi:hypothetical protein